MKKLVAIVLTALFVLSAFSACTQPAATTTEPATQPAAGTTEATTPAESTTPADTTEVAAEKVFRTYMSADCPTLNSHDEVDGKLQTPYDYCSAPLYRPIVAEDRKSFTYMPDLAAEEPIQIDATNWQIKLDEKACWWNGEPINADTMMYSYKMNLDPVLANQMSNYLAKRVIKIVNAEAYALQLTNGTTVAWEDVGIKKIDDYTIQITTELENTAKQVMEHFTDRSCFPVYEPLYEAGMNADRTETSYGKTKEEWMGCGPYILDSWDFDAVQVYVKNPNYWHADKFNYDRVEVRIIPTMNARVELWEKGDLDYLSPDSTNIDSYIDDPRIAERYNRYVDHIDINSENTDQPILQQLDFRKAMYCAMNREVMSQISGYMVPAAFYINIPAGQLGETRTRYRDTKQGLSVVESIKTQFGNEYGYNPELAKEYFDKAYAAAGCTGVVTLRMMYEDDYTRFATCTEYLQEELPKIFGADKFALEAVPLSGGSTAYKKSVGLTGWDFSWNDWGNKASSALPHTSFLYFLSTYASPPNTYFDAEFEAQYAVCESAEVLADYERLMDETAKLELIYIDKVIQVPIYQEVSYEMFSDRLVLPGDLYIDGFGWGEIYGDIAE